ncbi:MAG: hypothetical protein HYV03_00615 [Deltaproteobacteria bacterium]|nr:hypothetical protein [Deltaproteobacteria bacterium]
MIEQRTYLAELSGGTKVQERGWHLLRMGRYLKRRSGRIYFNFGESISYVKTLQRAAPEIGSPTALTDAAKPALVRELASTIMYAMNREAVVTPAALVATALLTPMQRAVTETELLDIVDQLCRYLQWKGAKFSEPLQRDREEALREVLQRLASGPSRLISRHEAFQPVCYALEEGRRLQLDYSKNTIIHFFASLGCLAVLLRTRFLHGEEEIVVAKLEGDYERLKRLFQEEFTFSTRLKPIEHITRLVQYLREAGLVEASEADEACIRVTPPGATRLRLFSGLLRNFFESYKVALLAGLQIPSAGLEEKALVKMMIRYGEHLLLLGRIRCPEAISQANFQNAIRAYKTIGLFSESGDQLKGKKVLIWQGDNPEGAQLQQALEEWC